MAQVTGRVFVKLGSSVLKSKSGAKLNIGGAKKKPVLGDNGVNGFAEETAEPSIECTVSHNAQTDLFQFRDFQGSVHFETDTGRSYVLSEAWCQDPPELTGGEGDVSLRFVGLRCEQVT